MATLVALLSTGKGTWAEVAKIIRAHDWEKVYLITNEFGAGTFTKLENTEFIVINPDSSVEEIIDSIKKGLTQKIMDTEVALNMSSGTGKEHMATLSALLKLGLGIRLITIANDAVKEL
ncbi:MAG: hypothetical protein ABIJ34_00500 [archaeon]